MRNWRELDEAIESAAARKTTEAPRPVANERTAVGKEAQRGGKRSARRYPEAGASIVVAET